MFDTILHGGLVYDGKGNPPFHADIAIQNGKIIKVAQNISEPAHTTVNAKNLWICPGFVDIHTHYDAEVEINPGLSESVRHGVTSIIMGNCSLSLNIGDPVVNADLFERVETMPELIALWQKNATKWPNTHTYIAYLKTLHLGPNVALLAGHSAMRAEVMGLKQSLHNTATKAEIQTMVTLASEALDAGCIGISIDMVHWHRTTGEFCGRALPSHHANYKEYAALANLCRERDAVFQLTPNPKKLWHSIFNIVRLSYGVIRAPLRCTILSAMDMTIDPLAWRSATLFASICNRVLGANIRFQTIPEPFTIYSDGPITPLFEEFESGYLLNNLKTTKERQALWQKSGFKAKFKKDWLNLKSRTFGGNLNKMYIVEAPNKKWLNKSIAKIANGQKQNPLDFFIAILEEYDLNIRWKHTGANHREAIRNKLMKHPFVLPGFSDAGAHCRNLAYFDSAISLIKQSVQNQFISVESAIKRITYEPAKWFNLDTGYIQVGTKADLVILNPVKLQAPLTDAHLFRDPNLNNAERMVKHDNNSPVEAVYIAGIKVAKQGQPLNQPERKSTGEVFTPSLPIMSQKQSYQRYRNRINAETLGHRLDNYWDIFVLKHQHKTNIALHFIAFIMMYAIALLAVHQHNFLVLLLMPLSQLTGLLGHYFYEPSGVDQRDTVFSWRALMSLHKLFYFVCIGRYHNEIMRVKNQHDMHDEVIT